MDYSVENKKELGRRIALARTRAGLSQAGLAILIGCNQSHIGAYETGKRTPKDDKLHLMAERLEIDWKWLKYGDETFYEALDTEYGKQYIINHFPGTASKQEVEEYLDGLGEKDLSVVKEMCELLMLDSNSTRRKEYFSEKEAQFKSAIKAAKEGRKHETDFSKNANIILETYKHYPDTLMAYMNKEITAEELFDKTWFKDVVNYPDIDKIYRKNPDDDDIKIVVINEMIKKKAEETSAE